MGPQGRTLFQLLVAFENPNFEVVVRSSSLRATVGLSTFCVGAASGHLASDGGVLSPNGY